jgi:hypothetical protein
MTRVVAFIPDLMDRSRVPAGVSVEFVSQVSGLVAAAVGADLVLVDLAQPGVLPALASIAAPTIGFASHVDRDLIAAAKAAGCGEVLARSVFFSRLPALLA